MIKYNALKFHVYLDNFVTNSAVFLGFNLYYLFDLFTLRIRIASRCLDRFQRESNALEYSKEDPRIIGDKSGTKSHSFNIFQIMSWSSPWRRPRHDPRHDLRQF